MCRGPPCFLPRWDGCSFSPFTVYEIPLSNVILLAWNFSFSYTIFITSLYTLKKLSKTFSHAIFCFMPCYLTFEISSVSDVGNCLSPNMAWERQENGRGVFNYMFIWFTPTSESWGRSLPHVFWSLNADTQHQCFLPFFEVNTHYTLTQQQRTSTKPRYQGQNNNPKSHHWLCFYRSLPDFCFPECFSSFKNMLANHGYKMQENFCV